MLFWELWDGIKAEETLTFPRVCSNEDLEYSGMHSAKTHHKKVSGLSTDPRPPPPHRQVHADVRPVQQGHPAGDDGRGVAGCRNVRGGTLGLPQPRLLRMFADGAAAQRPAQETQHAGWGG